MTLRKQQKRCRFTLVAARHCLETPYGDRGGRAKGYRASIRQTYLPFSARMLEIRLPTRRVATTGTFADTPRTRFEVVAGRGSGHLADALHNAAAPEKRPALSRTGLRSLAVLQQGYLCSGSSRCSCRPVRGCGRGSLSTAAAPQSLNCVALAVRQLAEADTPVVLVHRATSPRYSRCTAGTAAAGQRGPSIISPTSVGGSCFLRQRLKVGLVDARTTFSSSCPHSSDRANGLYHQADS